MRPQNQKTSISRDLERIGGRGWSGFVEETILETHFLQISRPPRARFFLFFFRKFPGAQLRKFLDQIFGGNHRPRPVTAAEKMAAPTGLRPVIATENLTQKFSCLAPSNFLKKRGKSCAFSSLFGQAYNSLSLYFPLYTRGTPSPHPLHRANFNTPEKKNIKKKHFLGQCRKKTTNPKQPPRWDFLSRGGTLLPTCNIARKPIVFLEEY